MAGRLAVAVAVFEDKDRKRVLVVKRPEEPGEEFAGMWGLPAATLAPDEKPEGAARRLGRQKLGLTLEVSSVLAEGTQERDGDQVSMILYSAWAQDWPPKLHPPESGDVTYYTEWLWAEPDVLLPTAEAGSLCCQLLLEVTG